jgi:long-chain acyl-CoA synthetase
MTFGGTLAQRFANHVNRAPSAPCLVYGDRTYTWHEVDGISDRLAARLGAEGVERGDVVGVLQRNTPELVWSFLACQKLGAVTSFLNIRVAPEAIRGSIELERQRLVLCGSSLQHIVDATRGGTGVLVLAEDGGVPADWPQPADLRAGALDEAAVCNVIHTSGTTGTPKGAAFTHTTQALSGLQYALEMGLDRGHVGLTAAPIVIGAATNFFVCYTIVVGAPLVLLLEPQPRAILDAIAEHKVTELFAVPTQMQQILLELRSGPPMDVSTLRLVRTGGSPVDARLVRAIRDTLGADVLNTYGTTESCTAVTGMHSGFEPAEKWSSIGKASYFQEVRVVPTDDDGAASPPGPPQPLRGQLLNRGAQAAQTQFMQPDKRLVDDEGWQHTRDIVEVDEDGYLYPIDRLDNVIISGSENIFPQLLEQVIDAHEGVLESGVTSLPDATWGELVVALVVTAPGHELSAEAIDAHCQASARVPRHWRPRKVAFVEALPRNILGKLDRAALAELAHDAF